MNPITTLRDFLQLLPDKVRTSLYGATLALGAVVALCNLFGVVDLFGVVTVDQLEQALVVLGPVFAAAAVANVKRPLDVGQVVLSVEDIRAVVREELVTAVRKGSDPSTSRPRPRST